MAAVREASVVSVPLHATGGLVDVFTTHGQTYVRDIQKDLVPRIIAHSGYRWHNAVARNEMIQILRFLTISKGGVYTHTSFIENSIEAGNLLRGNDEEVFTYTGTLLPPGPWP